MGVQRSSLPEATPLPWRLPAHGICPCAAIRSPGVWYAPGADPAISRLLFRCPTAGGREEGDFKGGYMVDQLRRRRRSKVLAQSFKG